MTDGQRAEARRRHPAAAWHPDVERMRRRLSARLRRQGHDDDDAGVASTLLALRGRLGVSAAELATMLGVAAESVAALEAGAGPGYDARLGR